MGCGQSEQDKTPQVNQKRKNIENLTPKVEPTNKPTTKEEDKTKQETKPAKKEKLPPSGDMKLKLVLVGDTAVGKSCLIINYLKNTFTEDYEPTVLDVFEGKKNVGKRQIDIEVHDTSGDEHLGVNRQVQYKDADCFMICVACNQRTSFENIGRWREEISQVEEDKPTMLVLTKSDLQDIADNAVQISELSDEAEKEGFQGAVETSSKEWEDFNVHKAFNKILTAAYDQKYML